MNQKGYVIKENGPVYYTKDMDKTVKWFNEVLEWNSEIDERNAEGIGQYGCVYSTPTEIEKAQGAPFTGIHLFYGEPQSGMVAFMQVQGIAALYTYVTAKGWDKITEVKEEPWGAKTCSITTNDGCILKFFES
jgi:AraC family transcriptional regulator